MLFDITERDDPDGARRLTLTGELDLASGPELGERLRELGAARRTVRLDLSLLEFIDSTGIGIIVRGLRDSARDGWKLEVDRDMPRQIAGLITITGIDRKLWPTNGHRCPAFRQTSASDHQFERRMRRARPQGTAPPLP